MNLIEPTASERTIEEIETRTRLQLVDLLARYDRLDPETRRLVSSHIEHARAAAGNGDPGKSSLFRRMGTAGLLLGLILTGWGCGTTPTESDRVLNRQTRDAGALVEGRSDQPEIVQAGMDIRKNAETLEKTLIGPPERPSPYSPAASEEARRRSEESHAGSWWQNALSGLVGLLAGGGLLRVLGGLFPALCGGPIGAALQSVVEGVARVRQTAEAAPDRKVTPEQILSILSDLQERDGVKDLVARTAHAVEEKLTARL